MNLRQIPLLTLLLCLITKAFPNENRSIPLDGFNAFEYNTDNSSINANFSYISGSPNDSFYMVPPLKHDTIDTRKHFPIIRFNALLGSEIGDPLLNVYSKPDKYPNRDHRTAFSIQCQSSAIPLIMVYRYRYVDIYSDRFDSIWNNNAMINSEKGLCHEHFALIAHQSSQLKAEIRYTWYERWTATPYFFSPLFVRGFSVIPRLYYSNDKLTLFSEWSLNKHSDYYNHFSEDNFVDILSKTGITSKIYSTLMGSLEFIYDKSLDPDANIMIRLFKKKQTSPFGWGISGNIFTDHNFSIQGYGTVSFNPQLSCSLNISRDHLPQIRPYTFLEGSLEVDYLPKKINQINLYWSLNFNDTLRFPITATTWLRYCSNPLQEKLSLLENRIRITQDTSRNSSTLFAGIYANYSIHHKFFHCDLTPVFIFPLNKSLIHYHLPARGTIAIYCEQECKNPARAGFTITASSRSSLNYPVENTNPAIQSFKAAGNVSVNFHFRVPFAAPLVNRFIKNTAFLLDAGPVRFARNQRIKEHPLGNRIGPGFYTSIEGSLW